MDVPTSLQPSPPNYAVSGLSDDRAVTGFLLDLRHAGRSPHTERAYSSALGGLRRFIAEKGMPPLVALTTEHLREYYYHLHQRNKPETIALYHQAVKRFYTWLVEEGERQDNPMERVKRPRIPETIQPHYTIEDVKKVLAAIGPSKGDPIALRDRALVIVLFDTGLRSQELCSLRMDNLDASGSCLLVTGKGGKMRQVRIGYTAATTVDRYLRKRRVDSPWLFCSLSGSRLPYTTLTTQLKRRFVAAGLPWRGAHAFRRGFAITFLSEGGDPEDLRVLAGWTTGQMLRRYCKATETERALKAHERFSPADRLSGRG